MRRIDKAFHILQGKARCEIVPNYCPYNIDQTLPDIDSNTYREETQCCEQGCRGISCEECWDTKLPARPARTDWRNATEEDIADMTIDEAIFIAKSYHSQITDKHIAKALELLINQVDKDRK